MSIETGDKGGPSVPGFVTTQQLLLSSCQADRRAGDNTDDTAKVWKTDHCIRDVHTAGRSHQ